MPTDRNPSRKIPTYAGDAAYGSRRIDRERQERKRRIEIKKQREWDRRVREALETQRAQPAEDPPITVLDLNGVIVVVEVKGVRHLVHLGGAPYDSVQEAQQAHDALADIVHKALFGEKARDLPDWYVPDGTPAAVSIE